MSWHFGLFITSDSQTDKMIRKKETNESVDRANLPPCNASLRRVYLYSLLKIDIQRLYEVKRPMKV